MASNDQEQSAQGGSTAIQAGGNVTITHTGLSVAEVRDVALDVFRANFFRPAGRAVETAMARGEQITEDFLLKLQKEFPAGFDKSHDPDFQYALLTVQKEYARNGDKDLGDLLVDLLVDRSKQEQRDILQIVLNESLRTAPKLTESQLAALAIVFVFKYTQNVRIENHEMLGGYFDRLVAPFASKIVKNDACYQHLAFCGCGSIGLGSITLESLLSQVYRGQFVTGFDQAEVSARGISIGLDPRCFVPCLNDETKFQVRGNSEEILEENFEAETIPVGDRPKIKELFLIGAMGHPQIREKCISIRPYMAEVFDAWSGSRMKNLNLTSVGIAIGHANVKRLAGEFADLSIWIN